MIYHAPLKIAINEMMAENSGVKNVARQKNERQEMRMNVEVANSCF